MVETSKAARVDQLPRAARLQPNCLRFLMPPVYRGIPVSVCKRKIGCVTAIGHCFFIFSKPCKVKPATP
jgi:hypothetical protein